jgi:ubiquinone/menaquinone biosynthesis C-methylase UbiE
MKRKTEPELMDRAEQATAYAQANCEDAHSRVVQLFSEAFPEVQLKGAVLDIGCGPGDITFRFAKAHPEATFTGVDAAEAMLNLGKERLPSEPDSAPRIELVQAYFPGPEIPQKPYTAVISNAFLHHVHQPIPFWQGVADITDPDTLIFLVDLLRPADEETAKNMIDLYVKDEPEVCRHDFYHSLLAAFELNEVEEHLKHVGLGNLKVEQVSDRHMMIYGTKGHAGSTE